MRIILNGEECELERGLSVNELLGNIALEGKPVVVEVNGKVVRKEERAAVSIRENDKVEVVTFVGGG